MSASGRAPLRVLIDPLVRDNPIALQVLGVCSALAVTRKLSTALVMSASVTAVLVASSVAISAIRRQVPRSVRLIIEITIIATFVIVVDRGAKPCFLSTSWALVVGS